MIVWKLLLHIQYNIKKFIIMSMEISIELNTLIDNTLQALLAADQNDKVNIVGDLMKKRNTLTMENVVKRSYVLTHTDRINEIKAVVLREVTDKLDDKSKPIFSNESKRSAEVSRILATNSEILYLEKQIDSDKDQIIKNDLYINNLSKLTEISVGLIKTI